MAEAERKNPRIAIELYAATGPAVRVIGLARSASKGLNAVDARFPPYGKFKAIEKKGLWPWKSKCGKAARPHTCGGTSMPVVVSRLELIVPIGE
jgi:hypothetical protein